MGTDDLRSPYAATVDKLLDFQRAFLGEPSLDRPALRRLASALVELSLAKDALAQERTLLALALARGVVDRAAFGQLNRLVEAYDDHVRRFVADAADAESWRSSTKVIEGADADLRPRRWRPGARRRGHRGLGHQPATRSPTSTP